MDFIAGAGLTAWFLDDETLARAFVIMIKYADAPMDLADVSLVVAAESLDLRIIFTIDRSDFAIYRIKRGHKHLAFEIINA
jgi:predicted nucleic acid-binding protein